jgi:xanthine dehydrogenase accessory factor
MSAQPHLPTSVSWPDWPHYAVDDDLLPALRLWTAEGQRVAVATLIAIDGSSPRPLGSEMLIAGDGRVAGYVSGGCIEAAVASEAMAVFAEGRPRHLDYGAGSPVLDIQLTCGGRIGIFVRELRHATAYRDALDDARARRQTVTVVTDLKDGTIRVESGIVTAPAGCFAKTHRPPLRLVVVGHDPVTLALLALAGAVGIETVLLRPNGPSQPPASTPLVAYDARPLAFSLPALSLDARTAVYSLSHDADTDHAVAVHALGSPAFVVGVLGSRRKIPARLGRLRAEGRDGDTLSRLRLPAGLPIGTRSPHGIAVSILAEVLEAAG